MNIIFEVSGGIGKSVLSTAVISAIKKKYPDWDIIVITAYTDVFLNNPDVSRAFLPNHPYFFEDYIRNKETKIFALDPYRAESYLKKEKHLMETWCDILGLEYRGELPKLYLSDLELNKARAHKHLLGKPFALIQPFGGFSEQIPYSWNRDIPFSQAQDIVKRLSATYAVNQIARKGQRAVAPLISDSFRNIAAYIAVSDKRIFIDSFAQHVAAALSLPSTVLWITNKPEVFGYEMHDNILARPFDRKIITSHAYLEEFDITGNHEYQYPYDDDMIFDTEHLFCS